MLNENPNGNEETNEVDNQLAFDFDINVNDDVDIHIDTDENEVLDVVVAEEKSETEATEATDTQNKESKHKIKGKHSLGYDSIFKGKKKKDDEEEDDEWSQDLLVPKQESFEFDSSSAYHEETRDPEEYVRYKELKEAVYNIILEKTDINIKSSRRKPGREDFNRYYHILIQNLDKSKFSYAEIFVDLSYYFSDNVSNMFKLLDKKWGGKIILELAKKRNIKVDNIDFL
jgi:hypothetical protein